MGACLNTMTVDGKASKQEITDQFNARCEEDGYECGNTYSGSFSEFTGLRITDLAYDLESDAEDYVSEHGEKWGPAVALKHKVYDMPKLGTLHQVALQALHQKVYDAGAKLRNARDKMRINNRSTVPAYVTKAEASYDKVVETVQPKIDERKRKIREIERKAAAKSKKFVWLIGGWCSS